MKRFIKEHVLNNIGFKILALALAFVFWLIVMNIQDPEMTKTIYGIPITTVNEDAIPENEYVYAISSPESINVTVTGKKSTLTALGSGSFTATADFSELSITNAVPIKVELSDEYSKYSSAIRYTQNEYMLKLSMETIGTVEIPVEVKTVGELPEGIVIDGMSVRESIAVTAPKSVLENLSRFIATVSLEDVTGDTVIRATPLLYYTGGGKVDESDENISIAEKEIEIGFTTSVVKKVPVELGGLTGTAAAGYKVTGTSFSFDTAVINGKAEAVEEITKITIPKEKVNIEGAARDVSVSMNLNDYLPEGVKIYDSNANIVVTVMIEKEPEASTEAESK